MGINTSPLFLMVLAVFVQHSTQVNHGDTTLLWTQKSLIGRAKLMGIPGDPDKWLTSTNAEDSRPSAYSSQSNMNAYTSHRVALDFRYSGQEVFFSDKGLRTIYQLQLRNITEDNYRYNVTLQQIYNGTSKKVYGLAVDWLAGNIYWTDALYGWISVSPARSNTGIYKHLIHVDADKPIGIVVHPHKGLLFWSDYGAKPRIERARLDGSDRTILQTSLGTPAGMSIDYVNDRLYWVDNANNKIEWCDFDGGNTGSYKLSGRYNLFGIIVFKNYAFVTDQFRLKIMAFNVSDTFKPIKEISLSGAIPYDIIMYDASVQREGPSTTAACTARACEHLCLNMGEGRVRCDCKHGYQLTNDGRTCEEKLHIAPLLIYTIGKEVCTAPITMSDMKDNLDDVKCFLEGLNNVEALAVNIYAELLFMADTETGGIYRVQLGIEDPVPVKLIANTGRVRGLAVDYASDHLYWSDEVHKHIMVSDTDGQHPYVLIDNPGDVRGLDIDVVNRTLYWTTPEAIMMSNLDGSNKRVFTDKNVRNADGLVVDPTAKKVYWTDHLFKTISVRGIEDGQQKILFGALGELKDFRDVTIYKKYIMWTTGDNAVYMGQVEEHTQEILRGYKHPDKNVSHDIIAYSRYLQPITTSPCDDENSHDENLCEQLCLPTANSYRCACAIGYTMQNRKCHSEFVDDKFLLLLDPYEKSIYQKDLSNSLNPLQGMSLSNTEDPDYLTFDPSTARVFLYDKYLRGISINSVPTSANTNSKTFEEHKFISVNTVITGLTYAGPSYLYFSDTNNTILKMDVSVNSPRLGAYVDFLPGRIMDKIVNNTICVTHGVETDTIYWMELISGKPTIFQKRFDGSSVVTQLCSLDTKEDIRGMRSNIRSGGQLSEGSLYAWSVHEIHQCSEVGDDGGSWHSVMYPVPDHHLLSMDVANNIYFSDEFTNVVYSILPGNLSSIEAVTQPVLSQIRAIYGYRFWERPPPQPTTVRTTTSASDTTTTTTTSDTTTTTTTSDTTTTTTTSDTTTTTTTSDTTTTTTTSDTTTTTTTFLPTTTTTKTGGKGDTDKNMGNNVGKSTDSEDAPKRAILPLVIGVVAAALILLGVFVVVVFICRRRVRKRRPATIAYNPDAHDNPVYMTHGELETGGAVGGAVGGAGAGAVGGAGARPRPRRLESRESTDSPQAQAPPLPKKSELEEGYMILPAELTAAEAEMRSSRTPEELEQPEPEQAPPLTVKPPIPELGEEEDGYMVPAGQDRAQLVRRREEEEGREVHQVNMEVSGNRQGAVTFQAS